MAAYESDSDRSAASALSTHRRGFVVLIVRGVNAVSSFEKAYPTHFQRCLLAKTIDRNATSSVPSAAAVELPYEVNLHQYPDWKIGAGFGDFMHDVIPEAQRLHLGVYNLSDWDSYDYWENTTASCSPAAGPMQWEDDDDDSDKLDLSTPSQPSSTISSPMKALKCNSQDSPAQSSMQKRRKRALGTDAPSTPVRSKKK